jgi:hypothetical protein
MFGVPVVNSCAFCTFYLAHEACGCGPHPVLPAPSLIQGRPCDSSKTRARSRHGIAACRGGAEVDRWRTGEPQNPGARAGP